MKKLSVVLATRNEEENIGRCLESVKNIADEIIVVDEYSSDKTREIAEKFGARVYLEKHNENFHETKQRALEKAAFDWILQLDADEVVTPNLSNQVKAVLNDNLRTIKNNLFVKHQRLIENRDGKIGKSSGEIVGYFIPRKNIFLGKKLIHAGLYPDGVIRLIKNGKARFPQRSVHEQMELDGEVGWLSGNLLHFDSPSLRRYLTRLNRYTDLKSEELKSINVGRNFFVFIYYSFYKPLVVFTNLFLRHKGFLDGVQGFLWSFFSATHFPVAYYKYWLRSNK